MNDTVADLRLFKESLSPIPSGPKTLIRLVDAITQVDFSKAGEFIYYVDDFRYTIKHPSTATDMWRRWATNGNSLEGLKQYIRQTYAHLRS